jgi:hypothetical protein
VAACEAQEIQDALADFWDMTLQFESEPSGVDRSSVATLQNVEKEAVKEEEDAATGAFGGIGKAA